MNTQQLDRTELISIIPPRDAQADLMTSLDQLRARFARNEGLPFTDVLTEDSIHDALNQHDVQYRDRVFLQRKKELATRDHVAMLRARS